MQIATLESNSRIIIWVFESTKKIKFFFFLNLVFNLLECN